jgi:hypothetical protein
MLEQRFAVIGILTYHGSNQSKRQPIEEQCGLGVDDVCVCFSDPDLLWLEAFSEW